MFLHSVFIIFILVFHDSIHFFPSLSKSSKLLQPYIFRLTTTIHLHTLEIYVDSILFLHEIRTNLMQFKLND